MRRRVAIKRHSPCAYLIVSWEQAPPSIVVLCRDSRQQICPQAIPYDSSFEPRNQANREEANREEVPQPLRGAAVGLLSLLRNEGGSVRPR
jgi:hypothetical protein